VIENPARPDAARSLSGVPVDAGAELLWVPAEVLEAPGDPVLLGARSLKALKLRVDPVTKRLVDAEPVPAGALQIAA
jgi:hypothetical protein